MMSSPHIKNEYNSIQKSAEDKRFYRGLELQNGMKVLLISDPTTDKSSAAMDVNIGQSNLTLFTHATNMPVSDAWAKD